MTKPNYRYGWGDTITGNRIMGWAGRIFPKQPIVNKTGQHLKTLEFSLGAECLVLEPITINKPCATKDHIQEGLIGKKIRGESEDYSPIKKVSGKTSGHRHLYTVLKGSARCVINIPIQSRQNQS